MIKYKDIMVDWNIDFDDKVVVLMVMNSDYLATKEVPFKNIHKDYISTEAMIYSEARKFADEYAEEFKCKTTKEYEEEFDYDDDQYYGNSAYTHGGWIS